MLAIWVFIAEDDVGQADRWQDRLTAACQQHALFPEAGRDRSDLMDGLRSFAIGSYVVLYLPLADGIRVRRVIHGGRDLPAVLD